MRCSNPHDVWMLSLEVSKNTHIIDTFLETNERVRKRMKHNETLQQHVPDHINTTCRIVAASPVVMKNEAFGYSQPFALNEQLDTLRIKTTKTHVLKKVSKPPNKKRRSSKRTSFQGTEGMTSKDIWPLRLPWTADTEY